MVDPETLPLFEKPYQHMPDMILAAEKDREDPDHVVVFDDVEPDDGPAQGHMAKAGKNAVMQRPAMRRTGKTLDIGADRLDTLFRAIDRRGSRLAETDMALKEKLEDELEVTLRVRRERDLIHR